MSSFGPIGSDLSPERKTFASSLCRADLHLHSIYSGSGHLRAPRLRSGLPEPEALYRAARARGMSLVTLTDLDTIDGCLAFLDRHPGTRDFFISEEVLAAEPRSGALVSVLIFGLDEGQHRDIQGLKCDVHDVAAYARAAGLPASLGSLLPVLEAGGSEGLVRELIQAFDRFEIRNGAEDRACNELMARLVQQAAAGRSFGVTAGSNAHVAARAGRTATVARAAGREEFFEALRENRTWAAGEHGRAWASFAEVLRHVPLSRAAQPLVDRAMTRARRSARARQAKRRLDLIDILRFQEKAKSYRGTGRRANPGSGEAH
ncbi:MAG: hypothetical protein AUH92_00420 [Acidobacteria bacterium 13_1_40CM_4_69_4]|nr:MAG: hypothetical protein AUH92_00420 [Acidobacteria bacterium 13_1_40CM_4_69_4]